VCFFYLCRDSKAHKPTDNEPHSSRNNTISLWGLLPSLQFVNWEAHLRGTINTSHWQQAKERIECTCSTWTDFNSWFTGVTYWKVWPRISTWCSVATEDSPPHKGRNTFNILKVIIYVWAISCAASKTTSNNREGRSRAALKVNVK